MKIRDHIKNLRTIIEEDDFGTRRDEILEEINELAGVIDECESKNDEIVHSADKLQDILY